MTTGNSAYLSSDLGKTWFRIDANLTAHNITSVHWNNGNLFLGTWGQGIVKSTNPIQP